MYIIFGFLYPFSPLFCPLLSLLINPATFLKYIFIPFVVPPLIPFFHFSSPLFFSSSSLSSFSFHLYHLFSIFSFLYPIFTHSPSSLLTLAILLIRCCISLSSLVRSSSMYIPFSSFLFSFIILIFSSIDFIVATIIVFLFPTLIICVLSISAPIFIFSLMNSFTVPSLFPSFQSTPFITMFFLLFSLSALSFSSSILLILPNRSFFSLSHSSVSLALSLSLSFTSFPFLFYFFLHLLHLLFEYLFYFRYHCLEPSFHFLNFSIITSITFFLVGVSFSDKLYLSNLLRNLSLKSALSPALPMFLGLPLFVALPYFVCRASDFLTSSPLVFLISISFSFLASFRSFFTFPSYAHPLFSLLRVTLCFLLLFPFILHFFHRAFRPRVTLVPNQTESPWTS